YVLHGYGEMQQTREEIEKKRQIYAENGRLGGRARAKQIATRSPSKRGSKNQAEEEGEREVERARTRATTLPNSWTPTNDHRERASKAGIDLDREVVKFRAYVEEKALTSKSWNQRFTRWLMNAEEYAKRDGRPTGPQRPAYDPWAAGYAELERRRKETG